MPRTPNQKARTHRRLPRPPGPSQRKIRLSTLNNSHILAIGEAFSHSSRIPELRRKTLSSGLLKMAHSQGAYDFVMGKKTRAALTYSINVIRLCNNNMVSQRYLVMLKRFFTGE
jgi:hypothetical protein